MDENCSGMNDWFLGYRGKPFLTPPAGPTGTQGPNKEQVLFIQFLYDIGEEGYGARTKSSVRSLQQANGIPVDAEVKIGPLTWAHLLDRYASWVAATDAHGTPHLLKGSGTSTSASAQAIAGRRPTARELSEAYQLSLCEEEARRNHGVPTAVGCFAKWPDRFGGLEVIPVEILVDSMLETAGSDLAGLGAALAGLKKGGSVGTAPRRATGLIKDPMQDLKPDGYQTPNAANPKDVLGGKLQLFARPKVIQGNRGNVRAKVWDVLETVASGRKPMGIESHGYLNLGGYLPKADASGKSIRYTQYDITGMSNRGQERLVVGSDGSAYFTPDHFSKSIYKLK